MHPVFQLRVSITPLCCRENISARLIWNQSTCREEGGHAVCVFQRQQRTKPCIIAFRQVDGGVALLFLWIIDSCPMMCKRYAAIRPYQTFHTHGHTLARKYTGPKNVTSSHENRNAVQCSLPICLNRLAVCMVSVWVSVGILNRVQHFTLTQPAALYYFLTLSALLDGFDTAPHSPQLTRFQPPQQLIVFQSSGSLNEMQWPAACPPFSYPFWMFQVKEWCLMPTRFPPIQAVKG